MRRGMWMVMASVLIATPMGLCQAMDVGVGSPTPLGPRALAFRMERNPGLSAYIARRGYPDWAEEVEVDSAAPLDTHEVRLYYLRLDREVGFTRAFILGRPWIGLQAYERPLEPAMRDWIERAYLASDPARRAELAAERATAAAERADRRADAVAGVAQRVERTAAEMEQSFRGRTGK